MTDRERFLSAAEHLLRESGCTVRHYVKTLTGRAYTRSDDWGIIAPEPTTARRFATFAHEVGHQMLHRHNSAPRWLEEWQAWEYALAQFDRFGLTLTDEVRQDAALALRYAAGKANRRTKKAETAQAILDTYPEWVWE